MTRAGDAPTRPRRQRSTRRSRNDSRSGRRRVETFMTPSLCRSMAQRHLAVRRRGAVRHASVELRLGDTRSDGEPRKVEIRGFGHSRRAKCQKWAELPRPESAANPTPDHLSDSWSDPWTMDQHVSAGWAKPPLRWCVRLRNLGWSSCHLHHPLGPRTPAFRLIFSIASGRSASSSWAVAAGPAAHGPHDSR